MVLPSVKQCRPPSPKLPAQQAETREPAGLDALLAEAQSASSDAAQRRFLQAALQQGST